MKEFIKKIFVYGTIKPGHDYVDYNKLIYNNRNFNISYEKAVLKDY
jgi:hypothetical protein